MPVSFRFQFRPTYQGEITTLLTRYKDKWKVFTLYMFRLPRDTDTYSRLARIRKNLPRGSNLESVIDKIASVDEEAARMLMDVAPLYNRSAYDFQTFVLAVIGVDYQEERFGRQQQNEMADLLARS